jgi:carbonic anhydrase
MKSYEKLLLENKAWAQEKIENDPDYFKDMAKEQKPEFLWIGCSDSRVPANEITNTSPGDIFVHRNVANLVIHTDLNLLSVVEYAVTVLQVKHIIVCGHYGCGGIKAALTNQNLGMINKWLRNIKDSYFMHKDELDAIDDIEKRTDRLVEISVEEQVMNLAKTSIVQRSWQYRQLPIIHGWVYRMEDGILKQICMMDADSKIEDIYLFKDL